MPSTTVNTVTGPLPVDELGVTLMHEHIVIASPGTETR
jgi:predicted metal-dependent phosphotriesterase family hydrolase